MGDVDNGRPRESEDLNFTFQVSDIEDSIRVRSGTKGRETKMCNVCYSTRMILYYLEPGCTMQFRNISNSSVEVLYFLILVSYRYDISKVNKLVGIDTSFRCADQALGA